MVKAKKDWIPDIVYEENESGETETIPLIDVPKEKKMPKSIPIWESRRTGKFEPGSQGQEVEIVERDLHLYIDMHFMKENLSPEDLDKVRVALGMKPLEEAKVAGAVITNKIKQNVEVLQKTFDSAKQEALTKKNN